MPTAPDRVHSCWYEFLRRHARTLWACDFMTQRVLTPRGWKDAFLLVFIHHKTRQALASPCTFTPDERWVAEQMATFAHQARAMTGQKTLRLLHDRDGKFSRPLPEALRVNRIIGHRIPIHSPNLNAYAERLQQTIQQECLEKFLVVGTRHLDYLVREYITHYNTERPHSEIGFGVPGRADAVVGSPKLRLARDRPQRVGSVKCRERLGGVLKHYETMAA
ncbi:MAG: integrase core domain-containing protein [Phycisphaerales bacterium]